MKKEDVVKKVKDELAISKRRMGANNSGVQLLGNLGERTKSDPSQAQFLEGDTLYVPESADNLFRSVFNGNEAYGVFCPTETAGGATAVRALYFSALDRSIAEYKQDGTPSGAIRYAKTDAVHDVFDAISACATEAEVFDAIKGKTIKVAKIEKVPAARYNRAGQVVGTRNRNMPIFTFGK